jgi:cytochrome c oxidase subunit 3
MSEAVVGHEQSEGHDHHHNPHLEHHFDSMEQQMDAAKIGMWLFLATEILLFGGLFCFYALYRAHHPEVFVYAHQFLDVKMGAINTIVLIFSSFTAAWAVRLAQIGKTTGLTICLIITIICGFIFMAIKYVEYKHKFEHGLLWGTHYINQMDHGAHGTEDHGGEVTGGEHAAVDTHAAETSHAVADDTHSTETEATLASTNPDQTKIPVAAAPPSGMVSVEQDKELHSRYHFDKEPNNVQRFFAVYFCMTALHGLHVIIGMCVLGWVLAKVLRGQIGPGYYTPVDLAALYWHLVDLIWIYLFPLLYLVG